MQNITARIRLIDEMSDVLTRIMREFSNLEKAAARVGKVTKMAAETPMAGTETSAQKAATAIQQVAAAAEAAAKPVIKTKEGLEKSADAAKKMEVAFYDNQKAAEKTVDSIDRLSKLFEHVNQKKVTFVPDEKPNYFNNIVKGADEAKTHIDRASQNSGQFSSVLRTLAAGWIGFQDVTRIASLADTMTATKARLNMINDGLQTTEALQKNIYAAAQRSQAKYMDMADMVAKLSMNARDVFGKNDEAIQFAENLSKLFRIAGTDATGTASTMYNLTQALSTGVLRGQDLNAVLANAPNIVQIIADHMGVTIGQVRALAAEGKITGETVKNAILGATQGINEQFAQIPMTFSAGMNALINSMQSAFAPVLSCIAKIAEFLPAIAPGIQAAILAFAAWKAVTYAQSIATFALTAAQMGLNAAIAANPLGAILTLIGLIVMAIVAWAKQVGGLKIMMLQLEKIAIQVVGAIGTALLTIFGIVVSAITALINLVVSGFNLLIKGLNLIPGVDIPLIPMFDLGGGDMVMAASDLWEGRGNRVKEINAEIDAIRKQQEEGDAGIPQVTEPPTPTAFVSPELSGIGGNTGRIAESTDKIKDTLNATTEELAYIRDLAEQEIINRFTTASISVDMKNDMQIASGMDIDGVIDHLSAGLEEQLRVVAEGVY